MLLQLNWMFWETIGKPMLELFSRPVAAKFKLIINSASKQVASLWLKFIDLDELFLETKFLHLNK